MPSSRAAFRKLAYSALKNAVKIRLSGPGRQHRLAVNTGSQADKNQLLFDGQADLINGSVQANEQYTRLPAEDQKAMRFVWLTARKKPPSRRPIRKVIRPAPAARIS